MLRAVEDSRGQEPIDWRRRRGLGRIPSALGARVRRPSPLGDAARVDAILAGKIDHDEITAIWQTPRVVRSRWSGVRQPRVGGISMSSDPQPPGTSMIGHRARTDRLARRGEGRSGPRRDAGRRNGARSLSIPRSNEAATACTRARRRRAAARREPTDRPARRARASRDVRGGSRAQRYRAHVRPFRDHRHDKSSVHANRYSGARNPNVSTPARSSAPGISRANGCCSSDWTCGLSTANSTAS